MTLYPDELLSFYFGDPIVSIYKIPIIPMKYTLVNNIESLTHEVMLNLLYYVRVELKDISKNDIIS